jgi:hypothetical protein
MHLTGFSAACCGDDRQLVAPLEQQRSPFSLLVVQLIQVCEESPVRPLESLESGCEVGVVELCRAVNSNRNAAAVPDMRMIGHRRLL